MKTKNGLRLVAILLLVALAMTVMASCDGVTDIVSFKVDFVVDGEVYKTISTSGNETISLPSNPTKEGYTFKGWYWDNETWRQPFTANSLLDAPLSGDMRIYAKFEKIENAIISANPVPGTAYKLFIDQENAGKRCYIDGTVSGYYLGVVSDIAKAANVYVEESGIPERFYMFCVKDGARKYINIVKVGDYYNAVYNNAPITAYTFNATLKTMVATVDGSELLLGTNSAVDYERIGTRYINEPSFVAHLALSSTPDSIIPDSTADEATVGELVSGLLGKYKTSGTVVGINAQSFLVCDGTGYMLVYKGAAWTPDVKIGDMLEIEGTTTKYGNAVQFEKESVYTVTGNETFGYPEAKVITAPAADAYSSLATVIPEYVKVKGTLAVSGNYYNLTIDGAAIIGSITYPIDDLTAFNGKIIEVEGFVTGVISGGKYLNLLATNIKEAADSDDPGNDPGTDDPGVDDGGNDETEISTLFEIIEGGEGEYATTATVVGINAQSFLIGDGTAYMLVYCGAGWTCDVKVGDVVEISGSVSIYGGAYQFGQGAATYEVVDKAPVNYPSPIELTADMIAKYTEIIPIVPEYVKVKGMLAISGNYYNFYIDGASVIGSITYPISDLSALDGKMLEIEGFVTGITGGGKYLNLMAMNVTEALEPDDGSGDEDILDTPEKIIEAAYALGEGETLSGKYTLEGVVIRVDQAFNPTKGNVTITVQVGDMEDYPIKCYRLAGEGADVVKIGDTVTVSGILTNYYGTVEFIEGCSLDSFVPTDEEPDYIKSTIFDVFSNPIGTPYEVNGTVVGINAQSFLIMDETGYILVYQGVLWTPDVKIGDTVNIKGASKKFGNCVQFDSTAKYEVTGTDEFDYPNPLIPDAVMLDSYAMAIIIEPIYVTIRGTLVISESQYYNIVIDGATIQGSFAYPIDDLSSYEGKEIELTGFITGTTTKGAYLTIMVTEYGEYIEDGGDDGITEHLPISDIVREGDYTILAKVYGINAQSFIVGDETGYILVYRGPDWICDVKVGDVLEISGTVGMYGGAYQFGKDAASYELIGNESVDYLKPKELTAEIITEYTGISPFIPEYVKVQGKLAVSGNYYNLYIDGASVIGSITYPISDLSALDGKTIEVEGFATGITGGGQYLSILAINITVIENSDVGTDDGGVDGGENDETEISTLSEIIMGGVGDYTTVATVYGINAQSFLLYDGTAYMLVYRGAGWICDVNLADVVKISGTVGMYGGAYQFGKDAATYEVIDTETVVYPDSVNLTQSMVDGYEMSDVIIPEFVKLRGKLTISGIYYNIDIEGIQMIGSIAYPNEDLSTFDGKEIVVEGFVTGITGGGKYLNLLSISIIEVFE